MAEAIDELFVRLGLESDQQQFQQAERQFDSLRTVALQAGAAIGAGFGLNELTFGFANATDEMRRFSEVYSVAPEFVDQLGFAFERTGGDASDAFESIRNVADLIEATEWGEVPQDAFREFGVDPMMLQGVESVADAYGRIVNAAQGMNPETARRFFSAMGFSESELRLARGTGDESFQSLMNEAESRAELTQSMQDNAQAFTKGSDQLARSLEGVSREISDAFVGDLGEQMTRMADFLDQNRDEIAEFADEALPYLKAMAAGIVALVSIQASRSALGILSSVPGLTAIVAGLGFGVYNAYDPESSEEMTRERNVGQLESRLSQLNQQIETGESAARGGSNEMLDAQLEQLREERESIRQMIESRGGSGSGVTDPNAEPGFDPGPLEGVAPDQAFAPTGNQTNISLNVDARGSRDPAATGAAVERGVDRALARAAENAILDLETGVS